MKFLRALFSLTLVFSFAFAQAAPATRTKKKSVKKEKIVALPEKKPSKKAAVVPPGRITQLPAFTAKRRTYSRPVSGVVIRAMSADEYKAYAAQADAEAQATALVQTKLVAAPLPIETMQIDELESQVVDEISEAPRPVVAEAVVPQTTVTTLPPLAPMVVAIPDSDEAIRQEMAAEKGKVEAQPMAAPEIPSEQSPVIQMPEEAPAIEMQPDSQPVAPEDLARTTNFGDLELRSARIQHLRLHVAYLDARYGNIESDLENGSSTLGLAYGRDFNFLEARIGVDFIHGLDQKVEMGDTRTVLLRLDAAHYFVKRGLFSPYVSSGLGYAVSDVRSYRSLADGSVIVRDHLESKSLAFIPGAGARLNLLPRLDFDIGVEYLGLFGGENASSLGGLSAGGSIGFTF